MNLGLTIESNASIKPIITTSLPHNIQIGLQSINLSWYIIDDNPRSYSVYKNGHYSLIF